MRDLFKNSFVIIGLLLSVQGLAQTNCPFPIINTMDAYRKAVVQNQNNTLIEIKNEIPNAKLDIKYARQTSITKKPLYRLAKAFARKPVVEALKNVQAELNQQGLGLKFFDGYRPYAVTCIFYAASRDTTFVAAPWRGSKHNRGCALDLTIVDLKTGKELDMPSAYDESTERSFHSYDKCTPLQAKNRTTLRDVMVKNGFQIYPWEWWHYDFKGWEQYDIMDIDFEELVADKKSGS